MRALVPGLASPYPLGDTLPSMYLQDRFAQSLCSGLDEVLAPITSTLDCLPAYLDPGTSPEDMLGWLAGWLGLTLDEHQSEQRQRELLRLGVELMRWRGTLRGVRDGVEAVFDAVPEITESGGAVSSQDPGGSLPGTARSSLVVRLPVSSPELFDLRRLDDLVAALKPAHVPHRAEVFVPS